MRRRILKRTIITIAKNLLLLILILILAILKVILIAVKKGIDYLCKDKDKSS